MTLALHDPQSGFYATREAIGAGGHFITAPEISQIFGEFLGLWCAQVWQVQGRPAKPRLVELGPGRGVLMRDALRALRGIHDFLEGLELLFVEASPEFEQIQRKSLVDQKISMRWVRHWSDIDQDRPLFLLANEFLDALPIRQFVMTERGWCERVVTESGDALSFALAPIPTPLVVPAERGTAAQGAVLEVSQASESLVEDIGRTIATQGGGALFIDYGHASQGFGDTLQAVARHKHADILSAPGEADISAHVDFAALSESAQRGGARVWGPIGQGDFLHAMGIETRMRKLATANPTQSSDIEEAVARLTNPEDMGSLFKVLAVMPPNAPTPPGF
ncbi:MAG TPA: SAM-dependent methyltransferase [Rhizomicrobium sp.]|jgi:NADH dehydrogenase [ubiquinone] 1 alpha subcomplex assembly factor 7